MEIIRGLGSIHSVSQLSIAHPVVTIGNFDGVHLGHQKIIQLAMQKAKDRGGKCIVFTFRPHPQVALQPGSKLSLLSTYDEKLEILESLGVEIVVEEPFSREFSTTEPEQFFNEYLMRRLSAEVIVVGYDFAFGKERHGHLDALAHFCQSAGGVELIVVPPQRVELGEVVSSSRIRRHLLDGELETASLLLGRPFSYQGIVMKGEGRGRKLGFPTANLGLEDKLALPFGVYATWSTVGSSVRGGQKFPSVTNIGVRPTFLAKPMAQPIGQPNGLHLAQHSVQHAGPVLIETYLLDQDVDLYGQVLKVQFMSWLRGEVKFAGIEPLKAQIALDVQKAREVLARQK